MGVSSVITSSAAWTCSRGGVVSTMAAAAGGVPGAGGGELRPASLMRMMKKSYSPSAGAV